MIEELVVRSEFVTFNEYSHEPDIFVMILTDMCVLFWVHWYPCLGFLLWVSKPEWVLMYLFYKGEYSVHSPRSLSGATPADFLMASITAGHFPTCINRGGILARIWARVQYSITYIQHLLLSIYPAM